MKKVKIGKSGKFLVVDDENFELVNNYYWHLDNGGYVRGALKKQILIRAHRLIMNPAKDKVIDHINGNKLDNRKSNLRICTQVQNMANRTLSVNNKTGYKGIHFNKKINKYSVQFCYNKKRINGGYFKDIIEAIKTYNNLVIKYIGEFGRLNSLL